jgi:hypothetical protein
MPGKLDQGCRERQDAIRRARAGRTVTHGSVGANGIPRDRRMSPNCDAQAPLPTDRSPSPVRSSGASDPIPVVSLFVRQLVYGPRSAQLTNARSLPLDTVGIDEKEENRRASPQLQICRAVNADDLPAFLAVGCEETSLRRHRCAKPSREIQVTRRSESR